MKQLNILCILIVLLAIYNNVQSKIVYNNIGHVPETHQIDWENAGLMPDLTPGGAGAIFDVTDPLYGAVPNDSNDDYTGIMAAINAAESYTGTAIVYFPQGTYKIGSQINLTRNSSTDYSNIILQGDGSDKTFLHLTVPNTNSYCINISGSVPSPTTYNNITNIVSKKSKLLIRNFNDASGNPIVNPGDWIHLCEEQFNDGWRASHQSESPYVGQITQIETINYAAQQAYIKDMASKEYNPANTLWIQKIDPIMNVGIEDLKIVRTGLTSPDFEGGANMNFNYAVNCWVKGVEFEYTCYSHLSIQRSSHVKVSGCYFHHAFDYGTPAPLQGDLIIGTGYGLTLGSSSTNCLIENNIFKMLRHAMVIGQGANCNVFTYNFSTEQKWHWTEVALSGQGQDLCLHGRYSYANLYEHNIVEKIDADDTHGQNGECHVFLRNMSYNHDSGLLNNMYLTDAKNTSVLGCELKSTQTAPIITIGNTTLAADIYGKHNGYYRTHYWVQENIPYDYLKRETSLLEDVSYYYSSDPYFLSPPFGFPTIGPNYTGSCYQSIPAENRFFNGEDGIEPYTYIVDKSTIVTSSGTLSEDENWREGVVHITGNVVVPSGITLTINPGTVILFDGDYRIIANAGSEFYANGAKFQSANNPATDWQYIKLYTDDVVIENCEIEGADYGVFVYNSDGIIKNCKISDCGYGIRAYHADAKPHIEGNDLTENDKALWIQYADPEVIDNKMNSYGSYTIYLYHGKGNYKNNTIESRNGDGVYIAGSTSFPYFNGQWDGYGNYFDNCDGSYFNVAAGNPYLGYDWYDSGGFNVLPEGGFGYKAVVNNTGSMIYAELNWWRYLSSSGGYPSTYIFFGDPVEYIPACAKPSQAGALWKSSSDGPDPVKEEFMIAFGFYDKEDYENAIKELRKVINKYPSEELTHQALFRLYDAYEQLGELDDNVSFLNSILGDVKYDEYSKHVARVWLMKQELNHDKMKKAEKMAFDAPEGSYSERELLLTLIAEYSLRKDEENAQRIAAELQTRHRDDTIEFDIQAALETQGVDEDLEPLSKSTVASAEKNAFGNSPNPFNSSTRLLFSLQDKSFVELNIYNVLGQNIKSLIKENRDAGVHEVVWNGLNDAGNIVPSGIYFAVLNTPNQRQTIKISLVK